MMKIKFFDSVEQHSKKATLNNFTESYLFLDGISGKLGFKKITVLSSGKVIENHKKKANWKQLALTSLKITSYFTIILPLVAICTKACLRNSKTFKLKIKNTHQDVILPEIISPIKSTEKPAEKLTEKPKDPFELENESQLVGFDKTKLNDIKVGLHPVYGLEVYNPKGVGLTYQMDAIFQNICEKHGVTKWLICGSVLGYERNNGRIAWDDDDDWGVMKNQEKILTSKGFKEDLKKAGLTIAKAFFGYKIFSTDDKIEYSKLLGSPGDKLNEPYRWPFIDIFLFEETEKGKYEYSSQSARTYWPKEYFLHSELYNTKGEVPVEKYGPILASVPADTKDYLKRVYGQDCMTHGKMGWDVENSRPHHINTKVVLTDKNPSTFIYDKRYPRP